MHVEIEYAHVCLWRLAWLFLYTHTHTHLFSISSLWMTCRMLCCTDRRNAAHLCPAVYWPIIHEDVIDMSAAQLELKFISIFFLSEFRPNNHCDREQLTKLGHSPNCNKQKIKRFLEYPVFLLSLLWKNIVHACLCCVFLEKQGR